MSIRHSDQHIVEVDFSNRKTDAKTAILSQLAQGESFMHDHTGMKTPFPVWIATRRNRMNRDFSYATTDEDGSPLPVGWYRIYIKPENDHDAH